MKLRNLFTMRGAVDGPFDIGAVPKGNRQIFNTREGSFEGERLSGTLAVNGGEWLLTDANGYGHVDAKVVLQTHDGANIYMYYTGIMEFNDDVILAGAGEKEMAFGDIHLLTQPRFETGDERYAWLNNTIAVAEGRVIPGHVEYRVFEVLPNPDDHI